jgi:uncharacterized protein (DUF4415 family)
MRVKKTGKGKGIVDVTEADHQAQLARIKDEDAVLKPGRYHYERGGFKRRHPDHSLQTSKVKISILLDADVLAYFRARAEQPHAAPYQTQINQELRQLMERDHRQPAKSAAAGNYASLLDDPAFIAAVAERVEAQRKKARRKAA